LNFKKAVILFLCIFLCNCIVTPFVTAQPVPGNIKSVFDLEYGGLKINILAPIQTYPDENITISIKAEAITEIFVKYIHIKIDGMLNATNNITLSEINHLENSSFSSFYNRNYTISIPNNLAPGLTYGILSCEWELMGSPQKIPESGFALTYIKNVDLEQLEAEYKILNATYNSLIQNYTELELDIQEDVDNSRNLMYVFIATTIVASITVFVLLTRKPKKIWI
jgi:hypothetical protein